MSTQYIGLKIGSNHTTIFKPGNGLVLKEASMIAMPTNPKNKDVYAVGYNAKKIRDRLPQNIVVYSPISNGTIQYDDLALLMLKDFIKRVFPNKTFGQNIKALLCTPLGLSLEEKKAFELTCYKAGIADVCLIPEVICSAIGNGLNIQCEKANMIVDIGGDTTNIAIISNNNIVSAYNISIGGTIINTAIIKYINETYKLIISNELAEQIKTDICSLIDNYYATMDIDGYNYLTNLQERITISSTELLPIIKHYYGKIATIINSIIKDSDPQIIEDLSENGINFFGGSSLLIGVDKFFQAQTSFKIKIAVNANASMLGAGELIAHPQILHKILKNL